MNSLFKKLTPSTAEALQSKETQALENVDVDELTNALSAVKGELEVAHASLQKIYEEASYVYDRLDHMERTMKDKSKPVNKKSDEEEGGEGGESGTGTSGVIVEKALPGFGDNKFDERLNKIKEAKRLTQDLLGSIEALSLKVKSTETLTPSPRLR